MMSRPRPRFILIEVCEVGWLSSVPEGRPCGRPGLLYLLKVNDLFENILILNKLY